jgi:hypothetical protein
MNRAAAHPRVLLLVATAALIAGVAGDAARAGAIVHAVALTVVVSALMLVAAIAPRVAADGRPGRARSRRIARRGRGRRV